MKTGFDCVPTNDKRCEPLNRSRARPRGTHIEDEHENEDDAVPMVKTQPAHRERLNHAN